MLRLLALLSALTLGGNAAPVNAAGECAPDRVTLQGDWGRAGFRVAVADTVAARAQGLMFVESMPAFSGMLFVYDQPQPVSFWMRNTLIPLDMIFADATGTIRRIHANAVPMDETGIPGGDGIQFVLEVNGGMAARLGLEEGDLLQHPAVGEGAALPCAQ